MPIPEINTVCFVGAGTMGCYNALAAAVSGYDVVLYDANANSLERVPQVLDDMAAMLVGGGYCSDEDIEQGLARTRTSDDLADATRNADLVSESVFEDLQLKRNVHASLDQCCPPHTLLTSNSSGLLVSEIEDAVDRGDRFAALHSHLGSPLVDIVPGPRTSEKTLDVLNRYVLSIRCEPLLLRKENPGYILNAILMPATGAALALHVRGSYSIEAIDAAWISSQKALMGPFGMMDFFGLSLVRDTWRHRDRDDALQDDRSEILALLEPMLAAEKGGVKNGAGFYTYPEPGYQRPGFVADAFDAGAAQLLDAIVIAYGLTIAVNDVASAEDIDRAWCLGMGVPRGPFQILADKGGDNAQQAVEQLVTLNLLTEHQAIPVLDLIKRSMAKAEQNDG